MADKPVIRSRGQVCFNDWIGPSAISTSIVCGQLGYSLVASLSPLGETLPLHSPAHTPFACGSSEQRETPEQPLFKLSHISNASWKEWAWWHTHFVYTHAGGLCSRINPLPRSWVLGCSSLPLLRWQLFTVTCFGVGWKSSTHLTHGLLAFSYNEC